MITMSVEAKIVDACGGVMGSRERVEMTLAKEATCVWLSIKLSL